MDSELVLTVREALQRPLFQHAQVIAGEEGLYRFIRWVHILEITSFETLIHGEEMILTTGLGFNWDAVSSITFLENLIKQNATCLCIEIGQYFDTVSEELIELANRYQFPLILFPRTVRFVDITQDLHSLIINRHHKMLQELESLSREFHRLTLSSQGTSNVLKLLYKSTQCQIIYRPIIGKPVCFPTLPAQEQNHLFQSLDPFWEELEGIKPNSSPILRHYEKRTVVLKPVGALDQTWAHIVMVCGHKPREYDYLLLDSASLSIAQELLRTRYMEERKLYSENLWVDELLSSRFDDEKHITALIGPDFKKLNELNYQVCLIEVENLYDDHPNVFDNDWDSIRLQLFMTLRSTFEKFSFLPLITLKNNRLAVIALDMKSKVQTKARLQQALAALLDIHAPDKPKGLQLVIGVGKTYTRLKDAYAGYQEAVQALSLYPCSKRALLFYEELGVFRLLFSLNDGKTLQTFIRDYLGPLIDHDHSKGSELLLTLKVYLDNDGSKQIAAQKLYIVRQSLYYRLEKISELLGESFMSPENRISIQVALRAYQLLNPDKFTGHA
ncbi:PucR family transcriptional regulator [Paenibacillus abyssi]|uniref:PucR family transcriptional regulator n=1 Tax=Paenibacillus abyssi TaxID=1340531 RepID=A0A917CP33_9BACL|nr:PucR family transcriptional regulator [Paenibacillus abyssi]GGF94834.1 PucR family transcriptional regulator [Paenibacillus abyssi]